MNDIIVKVQALQVADDAALQEIVAALQAVPEPGAPSVTVASVTVTFSDGSSQTVTGQPQAAA